LLLAHRFLQEFAKRDGKPLDGFAPGVASQLLRYDWPGNVRELRNTIEGAVTMARGQKVTLDDLPGLFLQHPGSTETVIASTGELLPLSEVERRHVLAILDAVGGNKSEAARILGVDRKTLQARLQRYGRM
ncbi:MAG TPA: helix-turn-helix domain-containing protein, partial [Pseudomonadota bacterium]|nr:helix-turn-helix domain-containing protein [Pseudomonadota bacterium]